VYLAKPWNVFPLGGFIFILNLLSVVALLAFFNFHRLVLALNLWCGSRSPGGRLHCSLENGRGSGVRFLLELVA
jgi:hypothetical protein